MLLAIDTATDFAGLALYDHDRLWAEETWYAARRHTRDLLPRLQQMLENAALKVEDLECLVVNVGPGSYTGVRVGISLAKGLALPHNLSVVGVSTFDVCAYPHQNSHLPIVTLAQAGRKRILVAHYAADGRTERTAPYITTIDALAPTLTEPVLITGEFTAAAGQHLLKHAPATIELVSPLHRMRRPGVLAEIGAQRLAAHAQDELDALTPIYVQSAGS